MNREEFISIAEKISDGSASSEEIKQFNRYYNEYQDTYPAWNKLAQLEKEIIQQVLSERISAQIKQDYSPKKFKLWPRLVAAAAVLLFLSFSIYFYQQSKLPPTEISQRHHKDFYPGSNKAFLTLENGRRIDLNDAQNTNLAEQSGISITKTVDGQLVYKIESTDDVQTGENIIETPVGGQYQVKLPDGTNVWLNASSSMKYPLKFSGEKRMVEITGEAYFEVAHNAKMPFVVKSNKQEVEVLGTHFNVMAYADEAEVQTTLLEGSVRIKTPQNTLLLKRGQQGRVASTSAALNLNADIESAIAWKIGKIQFADMNIHNIMRTLARWYDFDVDYQGKQINTTFGGSFSRTKNLSVILKSLESTGDVHFKIEGRRVTVMP